MLLLIRNLIFLYTNNWYIILNYFQVAERAHGRLGFGGSAPCAQTHGKEKFITKVNNSVTKGPKFRPQSTKRAEKIFEGPGKSGAGVLPDFSKKGRKGAGFS
jgi:hypothetical protein